MTEVENFITTNEEKIAQFTNSGLGADLDIGVTVGDSEQFTAYLTFGAAFLNRLSRIGVSLSLSAYPTSDEANEDE